MKRPPMAERADELAFWVNLIGCFVVLALGVVAYCLEVWKAFNP